MAIRGASGAASAVSRTHGSATLSSPSRASVGQSVKSATISFGQGIVAEDLARAEDAASECDLVFAMGTTLSVYPSVAVVPIAKEAGARLAFLNDEPTEMDHLADAILRGKIGHILPLVVAS